MPLRRRRLAASRACKPRRPSAAANVASVFGRRPPAQILPYESCSLLALETSMEGRGDQLLARPSTRACVLLVLVVGASVFSGCGIPADEGDGTVRKLTSSSGAERVAISGRVAGHGVVSGKDVVVNMPVQGFAAADLTRTVLGRPAADAASSGDLAVGSAKPHVSAQARVAGANLAPTGDRTSSTLGAWVCYTLAIIVLGVATLRWSDVRHR